MPLQNVNFFSLLDEAVQQYPGLYSAQNYYKYSQQYLIHVWIVSLLSLSAFIKFYYLYKVYAKVCLRVSAIGKSRCHVLKGEVTTKHLLRSSSGKRWLNKLSGLILQSYVTC